MSESEEVEFQNSEVESVNENNSIVENSEDFTSYQFHKPVSNKGINQQAENVFENCIADQNKSTQDPMLDIEKPLEDLSTDLDNSDENYSSCSTATKTETFENSSESFSTCCDDNSETLSGSSHSKNKKTMQNQLIFLEPNNPILVRFQSALKEHLLKQKNQLKQELLILDGRVRIKQNEKSSIINEINKVTCRVTKQKCLLSEFHKMKTELKTTKEQIEKFINQGKQRCSEINITVEKESKKLSDMKAKLNCSRGLLNELTKYEKEQEITFNICDQKKSQVKQYQKKLLNEQQKQDLLLLSLTQEVLRLEERIKQLGEQAEIKFNERELLRQKVVDNSTDLDAISGDNAKITLLWNDVLISIQQRDKSIRKIQYDFQEAKNKYQTLIMEANSYKRSIQEESRKNDELINLLNKLKQEQFNSQTSFETYFDKFNSFKDDYAKSVQIAEFQQKNLDQVLFEQKTIQNEINKLSNVLDKVSYQKLKYEEDILDELKKQSLANNSCAQINNKISELKAQNKGHELILVGVENNLSRALLKVEQYRSTISNMENAIEETFKHLNNQKFILSASNSELKKLYTEIQNKYKQIDLENKQLEALKKSHNEGVGMSPQMQIDHLRSKINEIGNAIDSIKQSWVQKQNKNVQLLHQHTKQINELSKIRTYTSIMETKSVKINQDIILLTKEHDQYKRTLTNMRNIILKLNEHFNQNKGKSSQLLNENEWMEYSYLAELKENEKQCLEYMDELKLLKHELNDIKNGCIQKKCEGKSWDTKIKTLIAMKKEMMNKEGDFGEINAIKNEIRRIQTKESQLKKTLEKIMVDLEISISKREMIYNKAVANKDIRLKRKKEMKQKLLKNIEDLRINIKKIKTECKKLDRNITNCQHSKLELESKLTVINERLSKVQICIDELITNIEEIGATKMKNTYKLYYKQNHAKFLEEVKNGKYRLLIKSDLQMDNDFASERKKNANVISVVETLKNDFPKLDFQIIRMLNMLKSIDN